jgi:hypothetical protein
MPETSCQWQKRSLASENATVASKCFRQLHQANLDTVDHGFPRGLRVAITLLQELPGNHSLWQQMAPDPFMESNLLPYITSSQLLDASIVSRLHGAPHSRGWDIRTGKVWVTRMVHRQRDGAICKDLLSMKRPDEDRIAVERTSDYWYVDYPNLTEKEAQTYHISLRGKVIERLNITEDEIISTKRLLPPKLGPL